MKKTNGWIMTSAIVLAIALSMAVHRANGSSLQKVSLAQTGQHVAITIKMGGLISLKNVRLQILFHVAHAAGYTGAAGGPYSVMVEDSVVYAHHGSSAAWRWRKIGAASTIRKESIVTVKLSSHLVLGASKAAPVRILVRLLDADWNLIATATATGHIVADVPQPKGTAAPVRVRPIPMTTTTRQRLAAAKSYYCYYGSGQVHALSHYDVVILHAPQMSPGDVRTLNDQGVVTLGYLCMGETSRLLHGDRKGPGGYASWYFSTQTPGQPDKNGQWDSYYANCGDAAWRALCVRRAANLIKEGGFAGLFLDCVNTYEIYPHSGARLGAIKLVTELRHKFPNVPIVLNQGFKILPQVAPLIDGVMLESFTLTWRSSGSDAARKYVLQNRSTLNWSRRLVKKRLDPICRTYHLKLFALDYAMPKQLNRIETAENRAVTLGCLDAIAPVALDKVYNVQTVGRFEKKWLLPLR
ncbi:MAG: hypothetical protein HKL96_11645 [Phycisphaerales bacterium]|nr:hypothetical protein [Phycisphaerales bacterium]